MAKETTFQATIADLKHSRPEHMGTPPGTKVVLDTSALDVEVAAKLFEMANGHPLTVTISEIQERMPMDGPVGGGDVPEAFKD